MIQGVEQQLDSYRLAKFTAGVPCYVCDGDNKLDADVCRHCLAPMAFGSASGRKKDQPCMIAVLGASGAGKTVYLGVLMDMLSRQSEEMMIVPKDAFSVNLQQMTMRALSHGEFPEKTPSEPDRWHWMHCHVSSARCRRGVDLVAPDMAGEAILEEIDRPGTYPVVRALLSRCQGAIVLLDAASIQEGEGEQEQHALKLATFLTSLVDDPKRGWRSRPIAFVLSKADRTDEGFDDPSGFARRHLPALCQYRDSRLRKTAFFASGVTGATAIRLGPDGGRRCVPLRIEPRGVSEPFAWLMGAMRVLR